MLISHLIVDITPAAHHDDQTHKLKIKKTLNKGFRVKNKNH